MGQILTGDGNGQAAANIHWCSPLWVTNGAGAVFRARYGATGIDLDPCANPGSVPRVGARVNLCLPDCNGLLDSWMWPIIGVPLDLQRERCNSVYVNPPFGRYWFNPKTREVLTAPEIDVHALWFLTEGTRAPSYALRDIKLYKPAAKEQARHDKKAWAAAKAWVLQDYETHTIKDWIAKCVEAGRNDQDVIMLGPAAVGTSAWQKLVLPTAAAVLFIKGRPKFELVNFDTMKVESVGDPAPMDCAMPLWTKRPSVIEAFQDIYGHHGAVVILDQGHRVINKGFD